MNQLQDVQKVSYAVFELDGPGNPVMDAGDTAVVTADGGATVAPDATVDPAKVPAGSDASLCLQTGFVLAGSTLGVINVTTTFVHSDGTPVPPPVVSQFQVVSGPPASGSVSFGVPVNQ